MATRILIADDHRILREGLRLLLQSQPDFEVIAEAENGRDAVQQVKEKRPDVVIIDVAMPNMNGMEATRQIMAETPKTKVIGLSMHSERHFVMGVLREGAMGYLLKDAASEELALAIRTVVKNHKYVSPGIADVVVQGFIRGAGGKEAAGASNLTPREREVLQLLTEGRSVKQIARLLHLSVKTIETHRKNVMDKLNLRTLPELTKYAIRTGLTSLEW